MNETSKKVPATARRVARQAEDLVDDGLIRPEDVIGVERVLRRFSLAITPAMKELIDRDDASDPIARQFVPTTAELLTLPVERADPIGDDPHTAVKGIVHRYPDRVLLKPLHVCPVYCRFCFRREKVGPGGEEMLTPAELEGALDYIRGEPKIWEVILTGGDPLIMNERRMGEIVDALDAIPHVKVIRIHTRVPVVAPDRITPEMIAALKVSTPLYVVLHCNHARELTPDARAACARLVDGGIPMLNQSVLLKGVNDDPETMEALLRALVEARVKPYYLHHGDLAEGTSHFRTTIEEGQELMRRLRGRVSGVCQPTYVLDIPGGFGKVPIGPTYVVGPDADARHAVTDYQDHVHAYPPVVEDGEGLALPGVDLPLRALRRRIEESMARHAVPGAAAAVVHGGKESFVSHGVTSVAQPRPVDADTFFQIGSITKTFTATAVMRLVERGALDLDAPLRTYVPDLRLADEDVAKRVTLRHVFTHTGGWLGDLLEDTGNGDDALARIVARLDELPQVAPLGALWSYNNSGLYLAGRAVEMVVGKTFEAAIEELVLGPLGMKRTTFDHADVICHGFAVGHGDAASGDGVEVCEPWALPRSANPLGGLVSTARDMLVYARFHLGDGLSQTGERILGPESMAFMQSTLVDATCGTSGGLSWWISEIGGARVVSHEGCTHGQLSTLIMVPERDFALVLLSNAYAGAALLREVGKGALEDYLGLSNPERTPIDVPLARRAEYGGKYVTAEQEIELVPHEGGLIAHVASKGGFPTRTSPPFPSPPPTRFAFYGEDRVVAIDGIDRGEEGEFLRGPDGRVAWFRWALRNHARVANDTSPHRSQS